MKHVRALAVDRRVLLKQTGSSCWWRIGERLMVHWLERTGYEGATTAIYKNVLCVIQICIHQGIRSFWGDDGLWGRICCDIQKCIAVYTDMYIPR